MASDGKALKYSIIARWHSFSKREDAQEKLVRVKGGEWHQMEKL